MEATRIENWSVSLCPHRPYDAPEIQDHFHLLGTINGKEKLTTRVVRTDGRLVTTKSGSVYRLGRVRPEYRAWVKEKGLNYDPAQPVKVRSAPPQKGEGG